MPVDASQKQKLLDRMRKNKRAKEGNRDPTEWRPDKVKPNEEAEYRLYILPPYEKGDKLADGVAQESLDLYYLMHGHHFINNKRYQCPRVHEEQGTCPLCDMGFDLMKETDDKETRSAIAKEWLSRQGWAMNIYFVDHKSNPEHLRGKVLWWSIPKAVYDKCDKTLDSDDPGDDDDPRAHGLFFDPENAFQMVIHINEKSNYNNYEASYFIGRSKPIGTSDEIEAILAQRHYLHGKFHARNIDELNKLLEEKTGVAVGGPVSEAKEEPKQKAKASDEDDEAKAKAKAKAKAAAEMREKVKAKKAEEEAEEAEEAKAEAKAKAKAEAEAEPELEPEEADEEAEESDADIDPELADLLDQLKKK